MFEKIYERIGPMSPAAVKWAGGLKNLHIAKSFKVRFVSWNVGSFCGKDKEVCE